MLSRRDDTASILLDRNRQLADEVRDLRKQLSAAIEDNRRLRGRPVRLAPVRLVR